MSRSRAIDSQLVIPKPTIGSDPKTYEAIGVGATLDNRDEDADLSSEDSNDDSKAHQAANLLQVNGFISRQDNTIDGACEANMSSVMINVSSHLRRNSDDFN